MKFLIYLLSFCSLFSCNYKKDKGFEVPLVVKENNISIDTTKDTIENEKNSTRDYDFILSSMTGKIGKMDSITPIEIESCIPISEAEYHKFYNLTNTISVKIFNTLDRKIYLNAYNNFNNSFKLYLNMSEYVDGEYAESYYDDIDDLIFVNKQIFCFQFENLSDVAKDKFIAQKTKYCK